MADVVVNEAPEALAERVAADFAILVDKLLNQSHRPPGWPSRLRIALVGGETPKLFYQRLAQPPYRDALPWDKFLIFWGDERCVSKDHPDSNYRMANEALLTQVPVRPSQVFRMRGEDAPPVAAKEYENILRQQFGANTDWPEFDLVFLGMGQDGHVASLLPGTSALMDHPMLSVERRRPVSHAQPAPPRWVVHNVVRSLQTVRLTLTLPAINHACNIWFLVTGAKKAAAFRQVGEGPDPGCPASLVSPVRGHLRWYVDKAVLGQ